MNRFLTPVLLATFALGACSGNNSGGITPSTPTNPTTGLAITSANAVPVTLASWNAANQSADLVGLVGTTGLIANNPGGVNKANTNAFAIGAVNTALQSVPFGPTEVLCAVRGMLTISGDIADPITPTLTANDFINVDADNCDDGLGEVLTGRLEMTIDSFTGDLLSGVYDLTATIIATNLQSTTAADVETLNGGVTVSLNALQTPAVSASVSGVSITIDSNSGSYTLSDFQTTQTVDVGQQPIPYTLNSSGTLNSSQLADVVDYTTPLTFAGLDFGFPDTGELLIVGENSSARLIAIDNVNVRIEIDNNGDNVIDETIDTTWAALTNQT